MTIIDWSPHTCPHLSTPTSAKKLAANPRAPRWQHEVSCWRRECVTDSRCCREAPVPAPARGERHYIKFDETVSVRAVFEVCSLAPPPFELVP